MTRENKEELLLKDLCARLPYDVKGIITYNGDKDIFTVKGIYNGILSLSDSECCHLEDFRPYLFPLSIISNRTLEKISAFVDAQTSHVIMEFFNSHHIDYRGLIEKGLAIDATGLTIYIYIASFKNLNFIANLKWELTFTVNTKFQNIREKLLLMK